eukprot:779289_1
MMCAIFYVLLCCRIFFFDTVILSASTFNLHSSCNSLVDGLQYIKPLQTGKVIPVICSNGYTMIDPSLHLDSITSYLSSSDYSRRSSTILSSELNDFVNWSEWWLPATATDNTLFTVSPACNTCILNTDMNNAYYMSNYYFCFKTLPHNECDLSNASLSIYCNPCDDGQHALTDWTHCYGIQLSADHVIDTDHNKCVSQTIMARPSMVTDRSFCTCYKPLRDDVIYTVSVEELPMVHLSIETRDRMAFIDANIIFDQPMPMHQASTTYFLTNKDFLHGTYRITNPGQYFLLSDIVINFNGATAHQMDDVNWSPNDYDMDDLYWWPTTQQMEDGIYPGSSDFHGLYTLGFFAAITIETDDVIINLNGHSISMSRSFYLQQRFFSIIELSDRNFIAAQGPSNLGLDQEFYASNVVIKDGILGLTSHHGIHGNNAQNITIQNVTINRFDVAGIALNGCNQIQILDCMVGPQNDDIPVLGRYTHARALLPRIRQFVEDFGEQSIQFYNRNVQSIAELADRLITQMDLVYFYVMDGVIPMHDEWNDARKLFINPDGWMDAGSSYGIVLNGEGASTLSIGARIENTNDITLHNVQIMGIYNGAIEKVKSVTINDDDGALRGILSDPIDWPAVVEGLEDPRHAVYVGDAYTDIIFAMNRIQKKTDWYYLHCMRITQGIEAFVFDGDTTQFISNSIDIECNTDIQMHSIKGAIGLRIDGVQNIALHSVSVHDIMNYGSVGSSICGQYETSTISKEDESIQYGGYTGNQARGIVVDYAMGVFEDIVVENVNSLYGSSWAIVIYKQSNIELKGLIQMNGIYAGSQMTDTQVQSLTLPNVTPKACSLEVSTDANVIWSDNGIVRHTVIGYDVCNEDVTTEPSTTSSVALFVWCFIGCFIVIYVYRHHCLQIRKRVGVSEETIPLLA